MIEFLENDLKVQEQKMLIREKSDEKRNSKQNSDFTIHILLIKVLRRYDIFEMKLMIILQLLVHRNRNYTKKRFQQLRRKGHCFQCLFPGESQSTGKHIDGKCQRGFCCKDISLEKYPTKKHALVSHEHRANTENEQHFLELGVVACTCNPAT